MLCLQPDTSSRHSLRHAVILFGKDGQAEVNSDLLPWTSTCAAGSSNRVSAAKAGMSGRYLELVLTEYGGETKTLAAQF